MLHVIVVKPAPQSPIGASCLGKRIHVTLLAMGSINSFSCVIASINKGVFLMLHTEDVLFLYYESKSGSPFYDITICHACSST